MNNRAEPRILWKGKFLSVAAAGSWEFATRLTQRPAVGIVAITEDENVVLVEQFRPAIGRQVLELPAGLAGDVAGAENEPLLAAARRELLEETGYTAHTWTELVRGYSSPGLTDEAIVLFLAEGLMRQHPGGGDASENITVHEVPLDEAITWIASRGDAADLKLLAGLYAAQQHRAARGRATTTPAE